MQKHLARMGFTSLYNTDPDLALKAKIIIAITRVPLKKIDEYLDALATKLPQELGDLLNWFEDTYFDRQNRQRNRRTPVFLPEIWNFYQKTLNGEDCINNNSEAVHRRLKYKLGPHYPTIWKLIDGLRKLQKDRNAYFEKLLGGYQPL